MSGVVVEIPGHEHHVFHVDLKAVLVISVGEPTDHLVIETWSEGRGLQSIKRH